MAIFEFRKEQQRNKVFISSNAVDALFECLRKSKRLFSVWFYYAVDRSRAKAHFVLHVQWIAEVSREELSNRENAAALLHPKIHCEYELD
jgi:hypothetical protein